LIFLSRKRLSGSHIFYRLPATQGGSSPLKQIVCFAEIHGRDRFGLLFITKCFKFNKKLIAISMMLNFSKHKRHKSKISAQTFVFGLVLVWTIHGLLYAAFEPGKWPCAYLARGSSGIAVSHLENGYLVNPALLTFKSNNRLGLFYRNYYSINDLNDFVLSGRFSLFKMPLGLSVSQFGDKNYHEQTFFLGSAFGLSKTISLGFGLQMFLLSVKHYSQSTAWGALLALHYRVSDKIGLAAVAGNLNEPQLNGHKGDIPVYFNTGVQFAPNKKISFSLDVFKDENFDFDFRYGVGYRVFTLVELLAGFKQQTHAFTAGIQINKMMVHFGYALEMHPDLGVSNAIEVGYVF